MGAEDKNLVTSKQMPPAIRRILAIAAHGFSVGDIIEPEWTLADVATGVAIRGMVIRVQDEDTVIAIFEGSTRLATPPDTDYTVYVLDPDNAGAVIPITALASGEASLPIYYSLTGGWVVMATGAASSASSEITVDQTAHGFTVGAAVRLTSGTWSLAAMDDADTEDYLGLVASVPGVDAFGIILEGRAVYPGASSGVIYYLSPTVAGTLTTTRPGYVFGDPIRAVAVGIDTDLVYVLPTFYVAGHEHLVPDGEIDYKKLKDPGASSTGFLIGYRGFGSGDDQEVARFELSVGHDANTAYVPVLFGASYFGVGGQLLWKPYNTALADDITEFSVLGNPAASAAPAEPIPATVNDRFLGRVGDVLDFFQVTWGQLDLTGAELPLGGDLGGTTADANVNKIKGVAVNGTAPIDNDILVYDNGTSQYVPGQIVGVRGAIITRDATEIIQLPIGDEGTILSSDGTDPSWTKTVELGTSAAGGATLKVNFAAGKYVEISATGVVTIFQSATAKVEVDASAKVTITYPSSNTVTFDSADFVGTSKAVKLREIDVCDAGVAKKMLILASATY